MTLLQIVHRFQQVQIKKECVRVIPLPVLHSVALELPISVERTTQRPHAEYDYTLMSIASGNTHHVKNTYPIGIYYCLILDRDKEIYQISLIEKRE